MRFIAGIALGFGIGGLVWSINTHNALATLLILSGGTTYGIIRYYSLKKKLTSSESTKKLRD